MKLLIKNTTIVTVNDQDQVLEHADLAVSGKTIVGVGKAPLDFIPDRVIDGKGKLVMPGLINAHTHLSMTLMRNYADDLPFSDWLFKKIKPLEDHLLAEDVRLGAKLGIAEMIRGGTTCFHDMYFFMDEVASEVESSGIRACLTSALFDVSGNGEALLAQGCRLHKDWNGRSEGRITVQLGPHSPYLCSPEYLREILIEGRRLNCGIHIHVSETADELSESRRLHGCTPVQHLSNLELFSLPTLAAHAVHLEEEDFKLLSENGVSVSHNPGSNLKLANGFAPVEKMLKHSINVALGTDGAASNNNLNLFEEIHLAGLIHKAVNNSATVLPAKTVIRMATINGAKALKLDEEVGSLETGKKADLIMLDIRQPHLVPCHDPLALLVYSAQASDVTTVMVDGNILMEERQLQTLEFSSILEQAAHQSIDLIERSSPDAY